MADQTPTPEPKKKTVSVRHYDDPEKGTKFCEARKRLGVRDYCPFCNERVVEGKLTLVVSNQAGIPNVITHRDCWGDDNLASTQKLTELYERAKSDYERLRRSGWSFGD